MTRRTEAGGAPGGAASPAEAPLELDARREALMREAAADMADLAPAERTLEAFERRTAEKAEARGWHRAAFRRQHLRHHDALREIYERSRFPDRKPGAKPPRGAKAKNSAQLLEELAAMQADRNDERERRRAAEKEVRQARLDNAVDVVREFISQMGLTPKVPTSGR